MKLEDLQGLTTEQKFELAAKYAGVPASVLDRQWTVESSRGRNLVGPETKWGRARGHFQFIDATHKAISQRLGFEFDRDDFDQSLLAAATLWKDNMRWAKGDLLRATAAYHGGTSERNWGPVTRDYVTKVAGLQAEAVPVPAPEGDGVPVDNLPVESPRQALREAATGALAASWARNEPLGQERGMEDALARQGGEIAEAERADSVGFFDAWATARVDGDRPDFAIADAIMDAVEGGEPWPAGQSYLDVRQEAIAKLTEDEISYLDEHGPQGPTQMQRALRRIELRRESGKVYNDAGMFNTFVAQMGVDLTGSPVSAAAGMLAAKVFAPAKIAFGAARAVQTVSAARRAGAVLAEGAVGNVLVEAAVDVAGAHRTLADYTGAALLGGVFSAIPARSAYRQAVDQALVNDVVAELRRIASERPATPQEAAARQREEIDIILDAQTRRADESDKVVPADLRREIEEEYLGGKIEGVTPDGVPVTRTVRTEPITPETPTPSVKAAAQSGVEVSEVTITPEEHLGMVISTVESNHRDGNFDDTVELFRQWRAETPEWDAMPKEVLAKVLQLMDTAEKAVSERAALGRRLLAGNVRGEPIVWDVGFAIPHLQQAKLQEWRKSGSPVFAEVTIKDVLEALARTENKHNVAHARVAQLLLERVTSPDTLGMPVIIKRGADRGMANFYGALLLPGRGGDEAGGMRDPKALTLQELVDGMGRWAFDTALHEIIHGVTQVQIAQFKLLRARGQSGPGPLRPEVYDALSRMESQRKKLKAALERQGKYQKGAQAGPSYAADDLDEFVAMALTDKTTQYELARMPAHTDFGGKWSNALREILHLIRIAVFGPRTSKATALDEVFTSFEQLVLHRAGGVADKLGNPFPGWPGNGGPVERMSPADGAQVNPVRAVGAARRFATRLYEDAEAYVAAHPVDLDRLRTLTKRFGNMMSDGLKLAGSKNPIMQKMASLLVETTTGAAGRGRTAAIRRQMLVAKLHGDMIPVYTAAFEGWLRASGRGRIKEFITTEGRQQFDREVMLEVLRRREDPEHRSGDAHIRGAADALEAMFQRANNEQKAAGVLGSDGLPDSSVGYIPQRLDGKRLAVATEGEIRMLEEHLGQHFVSAMDWNADFAADFARFYVSRAMARAKNVKGVDQLAGGNSAIDVIRSHLEDMRDNGYSQQAIDAALAQATAASKQRAGHMKHRLDVGLMTDLPNGKKVLDYYDTNSLGLARQYANRSAGTIALTEFGVQGAYGVRALRRALSEPIGERATQEELDAFDRVMSEFLAEPIPGEVRSTPARNLTTFTRLLRLGSQVITQAAESVQFVTHMGLGTTLRHAPALLQIMGDVGRLKRGQDPKRHILTSIETWGGQIGMENYNLVMPLEPQDARLQEYMSDAGVFERALNGLSFLQGKLSLFRAVMATQHRFAAEQITMKAARYFREVAEFRRRNPNVATELDADRYLRDMGIDAELAAHFAQHIDRVATWDDGGRLVRFDVTQVPNPLAAEAFVQAVHRGTQQIIQGTFIGERNAWVHNDYVKILTQLRTFGITAMEKQWSRQRANHTEGAFNGYMAVTGMLVAQAALILPLHLARIQLNALGREDQEQYIKDNLQPAALVRSVLNYTTLAGLTGDMLDVLAGTAAGWSGEKELVGVRGRDVLSPTSVIPALGALEDVGKMVTGNSTLYRALKTLPGANLPYVIPFLNLAKE